MDFHILYILCFHGAAIGGSGVAELSHQYGGLYNWGSTTAFPLNHSTTTAAHSCDCFTAYSAVLLICDASHARHWPKTAVNSVFEGISRRPPRAPIQPSSASPLSISNMKLSAALGILGQVKYCIQTSFLPVLQAIWASPTLLLRPHTVSRIAFAHIWKSGFAEGMDENHREGKRALITPNACGVILDIGAGLWRRIIPVRVLLTSVVLATGHGHATQYLNRERAAKYIALEPNRDMHPYIRAAAAAAGFTEEAGTFVLVGAAAEDLSFIVQRVPKGSVDTLICVHTMCSFPVSPAPQAVLSALVDAVLAPAGQLLMYEHVLSSRADVRWWQRLWTPLWRRVFDGCRLDRPTLTWAKEMGGWKESKVWEIEGEPEDNMFCHQIGRFVKE